MDNSKWDKIHLAPEVIEGLQADLAEQCRLLGMSGEREASHLTEIARLRVEAESLRPGSAELVAVCDGRRARNLRGL